jgi:hypothetical protein
VSLAAPLFDRLVRLASASDDPSFRPPPVALADGLWSLDRRLRMPGGLVLPCRTTILRDPAERLLVISPPQLDDETRGQVLALGTIGGIVAPNSFHHLFASAWLDAFPGIEVFAAPGLPDRTGTLPTAQVLLRENPPDWKGRIETAVLSPPGPYSEVAIFDRGSATLVLADVAIHRRLEDSPFTEWTWRALGVAPGFAPSRLVRMTILRDAAAAKIFLERILEWPFERTLVAHGEPIETDARERFRAAFASYLAASVG